MKQQQRWSIGRENWMQFQKESIITTKIQKQNAIQEAHSCLVKTILQTEEKTIPKTSSETVASWNEECEREERIVRAEYKNTDKTQQTDLN